MLITRKCNIVQLIQHFTGGQQPQKDEIEEPIEDEDLKDLYFRATLNLFDGMEMLEELLEHGTHGDDVPKGLETAILFFVCLFYFLSFLELLHLAFRGKEDDQTRTRWRVTHCVNTIFQIGLNVSFFSLRMIVWIEYKRDAAIFLAKNLISIVINLMPYLIALGWVDDKNDDVSNDGGAGSGGDGDVDNNGDDDDIGDDDK